MFDYDYPSDKYRIWEGGLNATWNNQRVSNIPGGSTREYYAQGACQCQSTLSQNKSFSVRVGIRRSGASTNLSTASLFMLVPKNGKSAIEKECGSTAFTFSSGAVYEYHVRSYAPNGIKGVYQGGVNDKLG